MNHYRTPVGTSFFFRLLLNLAATLLGVLRPSSFEWWRDEARMRRKLPNLQLAPSASFARALVGAVIILQTLLHILRDHSARLSKGM